jgi:hypothetical protein
MAARKSFSNAHKSTFFWISHKSTNLLKAMSPTSAATTPQNQKSPKYCPTGTFSLGLTAASFSSAATHQARSAATAISFSAIYRELAASTFAVLTLATKTLFATTTKIYSKTSTASVSHT